MKLMMNLSLILIKIKMSKEVECDCTDFPTQTYTSVSGNVCCVDCFKKLDISDEGDLRKNKIGEVKLMIDKAIVDYQDKWKNEGEYSAGIYDYAKLIVERLEQYENE